MTRKQRIIRISRGVRKWAEDVALLEFFDVDSLCGMCARASGELHSRLRSAGIRSRIVFGHGHCFLVVRDKGRDYVVDVTATQFTYALKNPPRILYRRWSELKKKSQWDNGNSPDFVFRSLQKAYNFQRNMGWPASQRIGGE